MSKTQRLFPCPCCGYRTLEKEHAWEICGVCWWEDDGQDNEDAHEEWAGSNLDLSLVQARINFLTAGICELNRPDLRREQQDPSKYERGRVFVLSDDGRTVSEPAAGWSASIA